MLFNKLIIIGILIISIGTVSATTWISDSEIVNGLGGIGEQSTPAVFQKDDIFYLISGNAAGQFEGFNWTNSTWQSDTEIVTGLGDVGFNSAPTIFRKNNIWYLISGEGWGIFLGFNWTGSEWQSDTEIVGGLGNVGWGSSPTVFQKNNIWYLISGQGQSPHIHYGFNWTGSTWQSDNGITKGLINEFIVTGTCPAPTVFQKDDIWYLISGNTAGQFAGFNWKGSTWQSYTEIVGGLDDVGWCSSPTVFQKDNIWYLISGNTTGQFIGYQISTKTGFDLTNIIQILNQIPDILGSIPDILVALAEIAIYGSVIGLAIGIVYGLRWYIKKFFIGGKNNVTQ